MYLTISQAAERLSVGYNTVRRAILSRELPALKIRGTYRIDAKVFEQYLESIQVGSKPYRKRAFLSLATPPLVPLSPGFTAGFTATRGKEQGETILYDVPKWSGGGSEGEISVFSEVSEITETSKRIEIGHLYRLKDDNFVVNDCRHLPSSTMRRQSLCILRPLVHSSHCSQV